METISVHLHNAIFELSVFFTNIWMLSYWTYRSAKKKSCNIHTMSILKKNSERIYQTSEHINSSVSIYGKSLNLFDWVLHFTGGGTTHCHWLYFWFSCLPNKIQSVIIKMMNQFHLFLVPETKMKGDYCS